LLSKANFPSLHPAYVHTDSRQLQARELLQRKAQSSHSQQLEAQGRGGKGKWNAAASKTGRQVESYSNGAVTNDSSVLLEKPTFSTGREEAEMTDLDLLQLFIQDHWLAM
jgi:hypothetical protein